MKRDIKKKTQLNREVVRCLLLTADEVSRVAGGGSKISCDTNGENAPTCHQH